MVLPHTGRLCFLFLLQPFPDLLLYLFSKGGYCQCGSCTLTDAYVSNSNGSSNYWMAIGF